jgi:hypothetical protein
MVNAVRTDAGPECTGIDGSLCTWGVDPVLLPNGMRSVPSRSLDLRLRAQSPGVTFG